MALGLAAVLLRARSGKPMPTNRDDHDGQHQRDGRQAPG